MLEKEVQALKQANTIPIDVDRALVGRGFIKHIKIGQPPGAIPFTPDAEGYMVTIIESQEWLIPVKKLRPVTW